MKKYNPKTPDVLTAPKTLVVQALEQAQVNSKNVKVKVETEKQEKQQPGFDMVMNATATGDELMMSHIEIAEIANKRSDSVKRTMDRLVEEGGISTPQFVELKTKQENGRVTTVKHYMLDRLDSITLMATVNSRFCAELVKRWDELESGKAEPVGKAVMEEVEVEVVPAVIDGIDQVDPVYQAMLDIVRNLGNDFDPMAVKATEKLTGFNLFDLFGLEPGIDLSGQDHQKEQQTRAFSNRQQLREKNRYDLDSYHSIRELGERSGKGTEHVRYKLLTHDLIQRVYRSADPRSVKYILTEKGQRFGYMYDPTTETFRDEPFDRIIQTNAQPVFNQSVLDALMR